MANLTFSAEFLLISEGPILYSPGSGKNAPKGVDARQMHTRKIENARVKGGRFDFGMRGVYCGGVFRSLMA